MHFHLNKIRVKSNNSKGFSLIEAAVVIAIMLIVTVLAIPSLPALARTYKSTGDGRDVYSAIAWAKMRAAADFTHVRLYADLAANSMHLEVWDSTASQWKPESGAQSRGIQSLGSGDTFGYGTLTSAPSNTQGTLGQAAACRNDANTADIASTACIVFNSRGIPVDSTNGPTGQGALYTTDGREVYGTTVSATGLLRFWRSGLTNPSWVQH